MSDTVDQALDQVIEQIAEGARPLSVTQGTREMLRGKYWPDFANEENHKAWPHDKPKVLVLARVVGNLATFLTNARASLNQKLPPTEVDKNCADLAAWLVSRTICPPPRAEQIRGRHCQSYQYGDSRDPLLDLAVDVARRLLKATLPAPASGPLAKNAQEADRR
jgi:hypothetical protein